MNTALATVHHYCLIVQSQGKLISVSYIRIQYQLLHLRGGQNIIICRIGGKFLRGSTEMCSNCLTRPGFKCQRSWCQHGIAEEIFVLFWGNIVADLELGSSIFLMPINEDHIPYDLIYSTITAFIYTKALHSRWHMWRAGKCNLKDKQKCQARQLS